MTVHFGLARSKHSAPMFCLSVPPLMRLFLSSCGASWQFGFYCEVCRKGACCTCRDRDEHFDVATAAGSREKDNGFRRRQIEICMPFHDEQSQSCSRNHPAGSVAWNVCFRP